MRYNVSMVNGINKVFTRYKSIDFPIGIFSQTKYLPEPHHHLENEIIYLETGSIIFYIDDNEVHLKAGDALFIPSELCHYIKKECNSYDYKYYAIIFDNSILGKEDDSIRQLFEGIRISRFLKLPDDIILKMKDGAAAQMNDVFGKDLIMKALLFDIITYAVKTNQYVEVSNSFQLSAEKSISAIDSALSFIHQHYREAISVSDILNVSQYSKSHFIRLFKKYVGMNITDYINKYRIERACLDLLYSNKNVTEIAIENGFNTVQYFSKIFKYYMSSTPKQYQKLGKKRLVITS